MRLETKILGGNSSSELLLTFIIATLCLLSCLSLIAGNASLQIMSNWSDDFKGSMTLDISSDKSGLDQQVSEIIDRIKTVPNIRHAQDISENDMAELVRPWLSIDMLPEDIQLPKLIGIDQEPNLTKTQIVKVRSDIAALMDDFEVSYILEEHAEWAEDIKMFLRGFYIAGIMSLIFLMLVCVATITFATFSAMQTNRATIEVLSFSGATYNFIAWFFARHYFTLSLKAALIGTVFAGMIVAFAFSQLRAGAVPNWVVPNMSITVQDIIILATAPVIAGLLAMATTWATAHHVLGQIDGQKTIIET